MTDAAHGGTESVYVVLEGGGAKGIAHVGALHAIEQHSERVRVSGIAGTSAGSIVAALAAAGYSAEDIFSLDGRTHILQNLTPPPVYAYELLGAAAWWRLRCVRAVMHLKTRTIVAAGILMLLALGSLIPPGDCFEGLLLGGIATAACWAFYRVTGLTKLDHLGIRNLVWVSGFMAVVALISKGGF